MSPQIAHILLENSHTTLYMIRCVIDYYQMNEGFQLRTRLARKNKNL